MKKASVYLLGWIIIAGLLAINYYLFDHFFKLNYLKWFVEQGAFISIITGMIYLFKEADTKDLGLISDHPWDFIGSQMQALGLFVTAIGDGIYGSRPSKTGSPMDALITYIIAFPLVLTLCSWFLVVIPCQYFVFLLCGAPARLFRTSNISREVGVIVPTAEDKKPAPIRTFNIDIREKPF